MREIKYKAYLHNEKCIVDVVEINLVNKYITYFDGSDCKDGAEQFEMMRTGKGNADCPFERCDLIEYTGLKDKDGKKIYEGDILECDNHWGRIEIQWHNAGYRGKYIDHNDEVCFAMIASAPQEGIEIIGNIYDNPELLEGA